MNTTAGAIRSQAVDGLNNGGFIATWVLHTLSGDDVLGQQYGPW